MTTADRRARRWLRAYPRDYRQDRGDEVVSTLLEKAREAEPRLPASEIAAVVAHGTAMRIRRANVVVIALALAVFGAVLGAGIGWLSGGTIYQDEGTFLSARIAATGPPSATTTRELRLQAQQLAAFEHTPKGRSQLIQGLTAPYPTCTTAVVDVLYQRGIRVQCSGRTTAAVQRALGDIGQTVVLLIIGDRKVQLHEQEAQVQATVASERSALAKSNPHSDPAYSAQERLLDANQALAANVAGALQNPFPNGVMSAASGPPTSTHQLATRPITVGAIIGLGVGMILSMRMHRRRPSRPVSA